jgi:hypothetical protein
MGYRSKVIIGVKNGGLSKQFDEILRKHNLNPDKSSDYLKVIDDPNEMKRYKFEQIKWYSMYDWCKEIMDWLEKIDDEDEDGWMCGSGDVFCVGLAYDDGDIHSEVGDYWEYVDVIRDINLID